MEKIEYCPNCNSQNILSYLKATDRHYGNKGEFATSICKQCQLVFMNPMPNDEELSSYYPEESYYAYYEDYPKKLSSIKEKLLKIFGINFPTKDYKFKQPGTVLDIGCGNGFSLVKYKEQGWNVFGVEPSKMASEAGNRQHLNIFCGTLVQAKFQDNYFDYIRSNHSFEHINNPNETLKEIYRILKPGGKLFIGVPNIKGTIPRLFKSYWYYFGLPVHTFNYSPAPLKSIIEKHKLRVIKTHYNSSWVGIIGSLQVYFNKGTEKKSGDGILFKFKILKPVFGMLAKFFNLMRTGDCIEIIATKE